MLGCMKSANDSLDISSAEENAPTLTQWGVASNLPLVAISKASPVWNARQSLGIETLTSSPPRVRMYRPEVGEGLETISGWPFSPHRSSMAGQSPVSNEWSRWKPHQLSIGSSSSEPGEGGK